MIVNNKKIQPVINAVNVNWSLLWNRYLKTCM